MHTKNIITAGKPLEEAKKLVIMLHGRGASAEDILSMANYLELDGYALVAPQATNHSWYPYSFLAPVAENEPWLSSALEVIGDLVADYNTEGFSSENIYFLGFSQGACLTLEFLARNAKRYGGAVAFTGGLIGDKIRNENYRGDFSQTPIFIGTGNPDPHVPVERVYASTNILNGMNAAVTKKVYAGMGHTINQDEIDEANRLVFGN